MSREEAKTAITKKERLTPADLDALRKHSDIVREVSSFSDPVSVRMTVELIDTIRELDETSTKLVKTTNYLATIGIFVAIAGILVSIVGVIAALK